MKSTITRKILLNPGPVTTTDSVKNALLVPDLCHREQEFSVLLKGIREDLKKVVHADENYTCVLFASSGTGAVEAMISSVIPQGKKIAIINNGSYGERLAAIAKTYGIESVVIKSPLYEKLDVKKVYDAIKQDDDIYALAMIHHETSTGMLNPLDEIGGIAHKLGKVLLVDAIASFAGIEIDVKKHHIDYLVGSSNKCLQGMPGVSFVICSKKELALHKNDARNYYFDLYTQNEALDKTNQLRFTAPVQLMYALKQALVEYFEEGGPVRVNRYKENFKLLSQGLVQLGFTFFLPEEYSANILTLVKYPPAKKFDFEHLHDYFYERNYTIYPDKLATENAFRLACIGDLNKKDIKNFLDLLQQYLEEA